MKFTVVTILPELIEPSLAAGVVGRARGRRRDLRRPPSTRATSRSDKHRTVDDTPYGGGPGMVMKLEPLTRRDRRGRAGHRILLSPSGAPLTQARVRQLATLDHLVLVCGRYEGVDQRVIDTAIDEELSLGDYVLSGGELGALAIIDAVATARARRARRADIGRRRIVLRRPARVSAVHAAAERARCRVPGRPGVGQSRRDRGVAAAAGDAAHRGAPARAVASGSPDSAPTRRRSRRSHRARIWRSSIIRSSIAPARSSRRRSPTSTSTISRGRR